MLSYQEHQEAASANGSWYLIHCQPKKETYAARSLRQLLNLDIFFPESRIRLRGEIRPMPFFPGYLFALADLRRVPASSINTCPGVLRLVEFGGYPQALPPSIIEAIARQLDQFNQGIWSPSQHFMPGESVRVKGGPLQNLKMVFVGSTSPSTRVRVLLEFLGRFKEVQVEAETLEKVPETLEWRKLPGRFTRGKGRKIHHAV